MGAVYLATDTKLNREVAIKVLPDSFAADPDRLARFTREAQVLASLNHPNIAAIYGVEEHSIVMELVEGHALAGSVTVEEALPLRFDRPHTVAEALPVSPGCSTTTAADAGSGWSSGPWKLESARNWTRCGTENRAWASCIRGSWSCIWGRQRTPLATATEGPPNRRIFFRDFDA
jgi:hypothetical protein